MTKPVITKEAFWTEEFMVQRNDTHVIIWYYVGGLPTGIGIECTLLYKSIHAAKTIYGRCKKDKEFTNKMYFNFLTEELDDDSVCL